MQPTAPRTETIPANKLVDPPVNPNHVSPEGMLELERAIRTHGFTQPILVRPAKGQKGKFEIIDGCHRRDVMVSIHGAKAAILSVVIDCTDAVATQLQIGMNRLRGDLDQAAVGRLVQGLLDEVSKSELAIGYSVEEIDQILTIARPQDFAAVGDLNLPPLEAPAPDPEAGDAAPAVYKLELSFTTEEHLRRAKRVLRQKAGGKNDFAAGFNALLESLE